MGQCRPGAFLVVLRLLGCRDYRDGDGGVEEIVPVVFLAGRGGICIYDKEKTVTRLKSFSYSIYHV